MLCMLLWVYVCACTAQGASPLRKFKKAYELSLGGDEVTADGAAFFDVGEDVRISHTYTETHRHTHTGPATHAPDVCCVMTCVCAVIPLCVCAGHIGCDWFWQEGQERQNGAERPAGLRAESRRRCLLPQIDRSVCRPPSQPPAAFNHPSIVLPIMCIMCWFAGLNPVCAVNCPPPGPSIAKPKPYGVSYHGHQQKPRTLI